MSRLHTWPGQRAVTLDVYVCNFADDHSAKARTLMSALVDRFQPEWTEQRSLDRGWGMKTRGPQADRLPGSSREQTLQYQ